jgi:serine protease Do
MKPAVAILVVSLVAGSSAGEVRSDPPRASRTAALESLSAAFEGVAEKVAPSVVQIFTSGYSTGSGPWNVVTKQTGVGSGVVIDAEGYIVTNAHVVHGARRIQVQLAIPWEAGATARRPILRPEGGRIEAEVVGIDRDTDLALLKIPKSGVPPLELGDSDALRQGQVVLAFGSPLGLGNTMTMGIVSAVARELKPDDTMVYLQTDAPINPGSSGGPLVDSQGRVVGINTMILSQSGGNEGVGLAIPTSTVRPIVDQLKAKGKVHRGVIGMQAQNISPTMATALKLSQTWGVIVSDLLPGGPAEQAGLMVGDVIATIDGKVVDDVRRLGLSLYRHVTSSKVTLEVVRGAKRISLQVPVVDRPDDPTRFLDLVDPVKNLVPQLDLLGIELSDTLAAAIGPFRLPGGVLVAGMSADASPPSDRFQPGDVIHSLNGREIGSLAGMKESCRDLKDGDPVVVQLERHGLLMFVAFEVD